MLVSLFVIIHLITISMSEKRIFDFYGEREIISEQPGVPERAPEEHPVPMPRPLPPRPVKKPEQPDTPRQPEVPKRKEEPEPVEA